MQKKAISLIIALSLVLGASASAYAVEISTPSAIKLSEKQELAVIKAAAATDYAQSIYTYITGTNGFPALSSGITAIRNLISNYWYSSSGFTMYYWNSSTGTTPGTVTGYAINLIMNGLSAISRNTADTADQVWDFKETYKTRSNDIKTSVQNIEEVLTTSGGISLDIGNSFDWPWGMYNYYIDHPNVTLVRINQNGTRYDQSVYTKAQGWFGNMMYFIIEHGRNMANALPLVIADVKNGNNTDVLTNSDLTTTSLEHDSLWDDLDHIGANLSHHLARLSYVLANDEEIAARQAAAANQDAVVDDFISSSGSASATPSDFGDVASAGSNIKNALSSNVSADNAFQSLSSTSNAWDWFSQSTLDSLDSTSSQSRKLGSDTPLLDSYYSDLQKSLMVKK